MRSAPLFTACALVAVVVVGLRIATEGMLAFTLLHGATTCVFLCEAGAALLSAGPRRFLADSWLDVGILAGEVLSVIMLRKSASSANLGAVSLLRMERLLRVLDSALVNAVAVALRGACSSFVIYFPWMITDTLYLWLLITVPYGVVGVVLFGETDAAHFGKLSVALVTLLRCTTLDGWGTLMLMNIYGCEDEEDGSVFEPAANVSQVETDFGVFYAYGCVRQKVQPTQRIQATAFFVSYIFLASFSVLSVLVGIATTSMMHAMNGQSVEPSLLQKTKLEERHDATPEHLAKDHAAIQNGWHCKEQRLKYCHGAAPDLHLILAAIIRGSRLLGSIILLLTFAVYFFSILGMIFLGQTDPWRFRSLHMAALTIFRCITLDEWGHVMVVNMLGCDQYYPTDTGPIPEVCAAPSNPKGWAAAAFFFVCVFCALLLLAFFAGAANVSMNQASRELQIRDIEGLQLQEAAYEALRAEPQLFEDYRRLFADLKQIHGHVTSENVSAFLSPENDFSTLVEHALALYSNDNGTLRLVDYIHAMVFIDEALRKELSVAENDTTSMHNSQVEDDAALGESVESTASNLERAASTTPSNNRYDVADEVSAIEEMIRSGEMTIPEAVLIVEEAVNDGDYTSDEAQEVWDLLIARLAKLPFASITDQMDIPGLDWLAPPRGHTPPLRRRVRLRHRREHQVTLHSSETQRQTEPSQEDPNDQLRSTLAVLRSRLAGMEEDIGSFQSLHLALEKSSAARRLLRDEEAAAKGELVRSQRLLRQKLELQAAAAAAAPIAHERDADDLPELREQRAIAENLLMKLKVNRLRYILQARQRREDKIRGVSIPVAFARMCVCAAQRNRELATAHIRAQRARWVTAQLARRAERIASRALRKWALVALIPQETSVSASSRVLEQALTQEVDVAAVEKKAKEEVWSEASEAIRSANDAAKAADQRTAEAEERVRVAEEAARAKHVALEELRAAFERRGATQDEGEGHVSQLDLEGLMEAKRPKAYQRMVKMKESTVANAESHPHQQHQEQQQYQAAGKDSPQTELPVRRNQQHRKRARKREGPPPPRLGTFRERLRKRNEKKVKASFHAARGLLRASSKSAF